MGRYELLRWILKVNIDNVVIIYTGFILTEINTIFWTQLHTVFSDQKDVVKVKEIVIAMKNVDTVLCVGRQI